MRITKQQQGMGLIEVMVALLLLAVAVMGFAALQMTALRATDESLVSGRALAVMRGGAEMMRANPNHIDVFGEVLDAGQPNQLTYEGITKDSCMAGANPEVCTEKQIAIRDALVLKQFAKDSDIRIAAERCKPIPSNPKNAPMCLIASWAETEPTSGSQNNACTTANGDYNIGSSCFVMEAY